MSIEIEAEATGPQTKIPKDTVSKKKTRSWASLTHSAQCSVLGEPHLDTSRQGNLGDSGVPYVESRGGVP